MTRTTNFTKCLGRAIAWLGTFLLFSLLSSSPAESWFVATNGNDAWSGLLDAPNAGRTDGPFRTPARAQVAVRSASGAGATGDLTVLIRTGSFSLDSTLTLDSRDSGSSNRPIQWKAYPGETPVLSGGAPITNWFRHSSISNLWHADISSVSNGTWWFNQLYVNDRRATRARFPNAGEEDLVVTSVSDGTRRIGFNRSWGPEDLTGKSAELFVYHEWACSRAAVASSAVNDVLSPTAVGVLNHIATMTKVGDYAFLEHAFSFLDQPGEWFLDRQAGRLFLMAQSDQDPNRMTIRAPRLEQVLALRGTWDAPVRNVSFRGLSLEHSLWLLPVQGFPELQAGHYMPDCREFACFVPPVAVELSYAEDCVLESCRIAHTGADGIGMGAGALRNAIQGCDIFDAGVNGVDIGWRGGINPDRSILSQSADWLCVGDIPCDNRVSDSTIHDGALYSSGGVGIWTAFAANTAVTCNQVYNQPYSGMSVGFCWQPALKSQRNALIVGNEIFNTCQRMGDGGGIYLLGAQPGTVIRGNLVTDMVRHPAAGGSENSGFYLDNGCSNLFLAANAACRIGGKPWSCRREEMNGNAFAGNQFGLPFSDDQLLLIRSVIGPRRATEPPPFVNAERQDTLDLSRWPIGRFAAQSLDGWQLLHARVAESGDVCLDRIVSLDDANACVVSLSPTGIVRCVNWWMRSASLSPVVLDVATSSNGMDWTVRDILTNSPAAWTPVRCVVNDPAASRVRIRRLTPNAAGGLELAGVRVTLGSVAPDSTPPSLAAHCSTETSTGQWSLTVSAHDRQGVSNVTVNGVGCQFVGNESWRQRGMGTSGSNDLLVWAMDYAGNIATQRLTAVLGVARFVSPSGLHQWPYTSWAGAATSIQAAIDACLPGDVVWVTNGIYATGAIGTDGLANRVIITNNVTVRSVNGPAHTFITGAGPFNSAGSIRCAYLSAGVLAGFTLSDGTTLGNADCTPDSIGGGAYLCGAAILSNCVVRNNRAFRGGGIHARQCALVTHCGISSNACEQMGGGVHMQERAWIRSSRIQSNSSGSWGGGVICDYGSCGLDNCLVSRNSGYDGGGVFFVHRNQLMNCTVVSNQAVVGGGGLSSYSSTDGQVENSILYSNFVGAAHSNVKIAASGSIWLRYSCSWPGPDAAHHVIAADPQFADLSEGALLPASPCIDAGNNQTTLSLVDLRGAPRIVRNVDLGCQELQVSTGMPTGTIFAPAGVLSYDASDISLTGCANTAVAGDLLLSNTTTGASCLVPAAVLWTASPLPLSVGTNRIVLISSNGSGMESTQGVEVVRGAPGSGYPALSVEPAPAAASTSLTVVVRGTVDEDAVGVLTVSNSANGAAAAWAAAPGAWASPPIAISSGCVNRIRVAASNAVGTVATAGLDLAAVGLPSFDADPASGVVSFITSSRIFAVTNNDWVVGLMSWSNAANGSLGTWPPGAGRTNQCIGGAATARDIWVDSARLAFDGDERTSWSAALAPGGWLKYDLGLAPKRITRIRLLPAETGAGAGVRRFRVEGSRNDRSWSPLLAAEHGLPPVWEEYAVTTNADTYRWYRLCIDDAWSNIVGVAELELWGGDAWRTPSVPLAVGTNLVWVVATNATGESVSRCLTIERAYPGSSDSDGDGSSDYTEWRAGTDPVSGTSAFEVTRAIIGGLSPVLRWSSVADRAYAIDWASNLTAGFLTATDNVPAFPPENVFTDNLRQAVSPLFYRIRVR